MVLFSFSNPDHIKKIQSGDKAQTTRQPRKSRKNGAKPYKVGDIVQLYYRSRQKPSCHNCILIDTSDCRQHKGFDNYCKYHSNFFGESVITEIDHIRRFATWCDLPVLAFWTEYSQDEWAVADGFTNFSEADDFFKKSTKDNDWTIRDWDIIKWNGQHIARRVA